MLKSERRRRILATTITDVIQLGKTMLVVVSSSSFTTRSRSMMMTMISSRRTLSFLFWIMTVYILGLNWILFSSVTQQETRLPSEHEQQHDATNTVDRSNNISPHGLFSPKTNHKHHKQRRRQAEDEDKDEVVDKTKKAAPVPTPATTYTCSYGGKYQTNRTHVIAPSQTPAFVLIGVQKSGTTALLEQFRDHPDMLQTKKQFRREGHFFDTAWYTKVVKESARLGLVQANDKHCLALQQYLTLFETDTLLAQTETQPHEATTNNAHTTTTTTTTNQQQHHHQHRLYTFEKTPSYFGNPQIPKRMRHVIPWTKIILILRNPVDRLYSQYKMTIKDVYNLRPYSLEDMVYHELSAMQTQFNMTTIPLPIPLRRNATTTSTTTTPKDAITAKEYRMPTFDSTTTTMEDYMIPPQFWTPNTDKAILKYPDSGPLGHQNLVRRGLYAIQLHWWLQQYTVQENLLILNYDDLLRDTYGVYLRILDFVNIPHPPPPPPSSTVEDGGTTTTTTTNTTATTATTLRYQHKVRQDTRKDDRPLSATTRQYLNDFYTPYNQQLESLLGPDWSLDKLQWN